MKLYPSDGTAKFKELMNNALSVVEYRIERALEKVDVTNDAGKSDFWKPCARILSDVTSPLSGRFTRTAFGQIFGLRDSILKMAENFGKGIPQKDKATNRQNHSSENRGHGKQGQA